MALAPICAHCGVVITSAGGTLGVTSAYGVGDPTITRKRVEADLAVFHEYRLKHTGMLDVCVQQLGRSAEHYADLPETPKFLELQRGLPVGPSLLFAVISFPTVMGLGYTLMFVHWVFDVIRRIGNEVADANRGERMASFAQAAWPSESLILLAALGVRAAVVLAIPLSYLRARRANGDRPKENAPRQKAHDDATGAALGAAERIKAATDHRPLRVADLSTPRLSPDGSRIAYRADLQIWVYDIETGNNAQFTFEGRSRGPMWSRNGLFVYFMSTRPGTEGWDLFRKAADGASGAEQLWSRDGGEVTLTSISSDGSWLVVGEDNTDTGRDVSLASLGADSVSVREYLRADWSQVAFVFEVVFRIRINRFTLYVQSIRDEDRRWWKRPGNAGRRGGPGCRLKP